MESSIYDSLLSLPLFQGLAKVDFESILDKVRLDFRKVVAGTEFMKVGTPSNSFVFLLDGTAAVERSTRDGRLIFRENVSNPVLFEPHSLFGASPVTRHSCMAVTDCSLLSFEKHYLYSVLFRYDICRMNMMNMLSGRIQNLESDLWDLHGGDIRSRFVRLMNALSDVQTGEKLVRVKMEVLADILEETRLSVSKMLNALSDEGLVELGRGWFRIPAIEKLA